MVRRAWPVRTCVGCRRRAPAHELLRIVAVSDGAGYSLRPDPARRLSGRGAHLHPEPACLALAQRRRAFGRALRITGVPDMGELTRHIDALATTPDHPTGRGSHSKQGRTTDMSTR
ncbi:YlxR family protein [Micromonospora polyrhachis]|uniref:YlxR family protein n=1 Tax=Micromonospora polyrhachis TaxID=1282883 RepID=UPI0016203049|nr:YlxR family protein [Micromonospora polyrhachis]